MKKTSSFGSSAKAEEPKRLSGLASWLESVFSTQYQVSLEDGAWGAAWISCTDCDYMF